MLGGGVCLGRLVWMNIKPQLLSLGCRRAARHTPGWWGPTSPEKVGPRLPGLLCAHLLSCTYMYVLMLCADLNGMCVGVYFVPGEATCSRVDYSNRLAGDTNGLVNSQWTFKLLSRRHVTQLRLWSKNIKLAWWWKHNSTNICGSWLLTVKVARHKIALIGGASNHASHAPQLR